MYGTVPQIEGVRRVDAREVYFRCGKATIADGGGRSADAGCRSSSVRGICAQVAPSGDMLGVGRIIKSLSSASRLLDAVEKLRDGACRIRLTEDETRVLRQAGNILCK